tara:strand:+ start:26 stop:604 length:579 start_codon:yes stop_codon:yes gene_type:complete
MKNSEDGYTIACGAVQAKSRSALYGCYECRMKASGLTASTAFWMVSDPIKHPPGELKQELIVQLSIGKSKQFGHHMKSNAMSGLKEPGKERLKAEVTQRAKLKSGAADEFHTYGCWWIDANTMKFYADGQHVYTINPSTKFDAKPFRHPLKITLTCSTFDWQPKPTKEELTDPKLNSALFDYVRAYKLVKTD